MKSALLFANGQVARSEIKRIQHEHFDVIVAADGGADKAYRNGYFPDYVIGDFDSLSPQVKLKLSKAQFILRPSQELNDLEKALMFCEKLSIESLTLLGVCGKRLDHTLNNLSVISRYDQKFHLKIYDVNSRIFLVRDKWVYAGKSKQLISLIPQGIAEGITTKGLAFPLKNESLAFGQREGLSNYIISNPVSVSLTDGLLFVFVIDNKE